MIKAIAIDDEPLALTVIESLCDKCDFITLQKTFTKPTEALRHLRKYPTDLIFVDIQMPSMTGINLVKSLSQNTMVIFTTAFSEYAAVSYDLNAVDYLLKPINYTRFSQAATKARDYFNYLNNSDNGAAKHIYVRADFSLVKISLADIQYIEGLADYVKIYINDRKTLVVRMTMKELANKLPSNDFIRVHRSFILPFGKIESVRGSTLIAGNKEFPIGKTFIDEFYSRYKEHS